MRRSVPEAMRAMFARWRKRISAATPAADTVTGSSLSNSIVAGASVVYFWARAVHVLAYAFAIPWVRTLAFAVGFFAQAAIAWQILAR